MRGASGSYDAGRCAAAAKKEDKMAGDPAKASCSAGHDGGNPAHVPVVLLSDPALFHAFKSSGHSADELSDGSRTSASPGKPTAAAYLAYSGGIDRGCFQDLRKGLQDVRRAARSRAEPGETGGMAAARLSGLPACCHSDPAQAEPLEALAYDGGSCADPACPSCRQA